MRATWRSWLAAVAGAWFVLSTWIFQATGTVYWSFIILGGLMLLGALYTSLSRPTEMVWRSWLDALFGALLAISPWVLGFVGHTVEFWLTFGIAVVFGVALNVWIATAPRLGEAVPHGSDTSKDSRRTA